MQYIECQKYIALAYTQNLCEIKTPQIGETLYTNTPYCNLNSDALYSDVLDTLLQTALNCDLQKHPIWATRDIPTLYIAL